MTTLLLQGVLFTLALLKTHAVECSWTRNRSDVFHFDLNSTNSTGSLNDAPATEEGTSIEEIVCPEMVFIPKHGVIKKSDHNALNSTLTLGCSNGYFAPKLDEHFVRCVLSPDNLTASWVGKFAPCQASTCDKPPNFGVGFYFTSGKLASFGVGATVQYHCSGFFQPLEGNRPTNLTLFKHECKLLSVQPEWVPGFGIDSRNLCGCDPPPEPFQHSNSVWIKNRAHIAQFANISVYSVGSIITFGCESGYTAVWANNTADVARNFQCLAPQTTDGESMWNGSFGVVLLQYCEATNDLSLTSKIKCGESCLVGVLIALFAVGIVIVGAALARRFFKPPRSTNSSDPPGESQMNLLGHDASGAKNRGTVHFY